MPLHNIGTMIAQEYFTTEEVADLFRVNKSTVKRWTIEGKLECSRTPGGHRRFLRQDLSSFSVQFHYLNEDIRTRIFRQDEAYYILSMLKEPQYRSLQSVLFSSALRGNALEIHRLLAKICPDHLSFADAVILLLLPLITKALRLKECDKIGASDAKLIQHTISYAAVTLASGLAPEPRIKRTLMMFTLESDLLPELSILEALWTLQGCTVFNFRIPDDPRTIRQWCCDHAPESILLLVRHQHNREDIRYWISAMMGLEQEEQIPVVIGTLAVLLKWAERSNDLPEAVPHTGMVPTPSEGMVTA